MAFSDCRYNSFAPLEEVEVEAATKPVRSDIPEKPAARSRSDIPPTPTGRSGGSVKNDCWTYSPAMVRVKICSYWKSGTCTHSVNSDGCHYANGHTVMHSIPIPGRLYPEAVKVCKYYLEGRCRFKGHNISHKMVTASGEIFDVHHV